MRNSARRNEDQENVDRLLGARRGEGQPRARRVLDPDARLRRRRLRDIGTSPLYALKESLTAAAAGGALTREMVLGVMSLMLWALIVVVTLKYVLLIMRADNNGEGGTLAL